jgi:multicomponent Na+:H+ antiporter subunit B
MTAEFDINLAINIALLGMLVALSIAIARMRNLLAAILLMGIYSLVSAVWLVVADAADVAFTEAVVGAGVSTIVLLGAIVLTGAESEKHDWQDLIAPGLAAVAVGGLLVYAVASLPDFGDPASPANAYVGHSYLKNAMRDTGARNVVTAVLASYRSLDTLGETSVIFVAGIGVALMLGMGEGMASRSARATPGQREDHHVVLRVAAKLLIPIIALFALYVQFHGELGAGGGFQAGVILAVAVILHALVFGLRETMRAIPPGFVRGVASLGMLVYAGVGIACMLNGGGFLDYSHLFPPEIEAEIPGWLLGSAPHHWGQFFGIFLIELGVLFTVAATMATIFYAFAGRGAERERAAA